MDERGEAGITTRGHGSPHALLFRARIAALVPARAKRARSAAKNLPAFWTFSIDALSCAPRVRLLPLTLTNGHRGPARDPPRMAEKPGPRARLPMERGGCRGQASREGDPGEE